MSAALAGIFINRPDVYEENRNEVEAIDYQSPNAPQAFVESLRLTGFGVLKNHPIQQQLVEDIYTQWQTSLIRMKKWISSTTKACKTVFSRQHFGNREGAGPKILKNIIIIRKCPDSLKATLADYYQRAQDLASELLGWVEKYSPDDVAKHYSQSLCTVETSDQTLLRVLHYPPLTGYILMQSARLLMKILIY